MKIDKRILKQNRKITIVTAIWFIITAFVWIVLPLTFKREHSVVMSGQFFGISFTYDPNGFKYLIQIAYRFFIGMVLAMISFICYCKYRVYQRKIEDKLWDTIENETKTR